MSDLTKRIDLFKLRIALEDAKAERDNYLGLLVRETATKAGLARELEMALQEIDCLRADSDPPRTPGR